MWENLADTLLTLLKDDSIMEPQDNAKECATVPRPKGSKNKKSTTAVSPVLDLAAIEEKMAQITTEIEELSTQLKTKKDELKELGKQKLAAEKAAAERKAEEDKKAILAAVEASGKSLEEILELLK